MRKLWLVFSQTTTVALAIVFSLSVFQPDWLGWLGQSKNTAPGIVTLKEAPPVNEFSTATASYRKASKKALPSVVHIFTSQKTRVQRNPLFDEPFFRHFFGGRPEAEEKRTSGLGSGVIVSANGYILTNFHVINGADQIEIALTDGRNFNARVVGSDPDTDLAVLQAVQPNQSTPKNAAELNLPAITLGQMNDIDVGDVVLAIGNPFGVGQTVTMGIISALGRSHLGINTFENFIQTDAAINPGNSGGALITSQGNLIGINTAIYSRSGGSLGIGFAIPISTTKQIMEEIIQTGRVTRGWVGIEVQEITPELAQSFGFPDQSGVLIAGVQRGSPAEKGGIQPGDTLLAVEGNAVKTPQAMLDLIAAKKPDSLIPFTLRRGKNTIELTVRIGERPRRKSD